MAQPSLVILLVEDNVQERLIYRYLLKCGLKRHQISIEKSTVGKGSAERWVRDRFPAELRACRSRQAETRLIAVIDADTLTVEERKRQLDTALRQAETPLLTAQESSQVARLVPKRNIETWILCLNGEEVTEDDDYKKHHKNTRDDWSEQISPAANALYELTRRNTQRPQNCVDSLADGIEELRNLGF